MAKKAYVGVANTAANVVKQYIGVNNVARKIVKGYVGVNNVAQQFWGESLKDGFWFFYETKANVDDVSIYVRNYKKTLNGIAFYASFGGWYPNSRIWSPLFVSTDIDAVNYTWFGADAPATYKGTFEVNGDTWYWAAWDGLMLKGSYTHNPPYLLGDGYDSTVDQAAPAKDLVDRIYTDDFAEDYQENTTYNAVFGDVEKTIRKALAIWLYKNITYKSYNSYATLLTNFETIVSRILTELGNNNIVDITTSMSMYSPYNIYISVVSVNSSSPRTFTTGTQQQAQGYTYFPKSRYIDTNRRTTVTISGSNITYESALYSGNVGIVGASVNAPGSSILGYSVRISNLGLDL